MLILRLIYYKINTMKWIEVAEIDSGQSEEFQSSPDAV